MTVINNSDRNQYVATAGQTIFNYTFEIMSQNNIAVYKRAAGSTANDAIDQLILTTNYTVTGVNNNSGGTIVLVVGATVGDILTIVSNVPASRLTSFATGGVIAASNLNDELDQQTLLEQQALTIMRTQIPKYYNNAVIGAKDLILPILGASESWMMNSANTAITTETFITVATLGSTIGASMVGLNPTGTVQDMANQKFILQVASATMPNAQSLGALGSGIMKTATGSGVVSISNPLTSLDAVGIDVDEMAYGSGANTYALTGLTAFSRTLLDDVSAAAWLATLGAPSLAQAFLVSNNLSEGNAITKRFNLGLVIGTDVQAWDATLQSLAALGTAADKIAYTNGVDTWAETGLSAYSRTILPLLDLAAWQVALGIPGGGGAYFAIANNLSEGVPATIRTNIGLVIGTDVQAYDATLQSLSALGTMSDKIAYTTGVDTWAETGISSLGRNLIDDMTQADMNTTIGSVPLAGGTMTGALYLSGSPLLGSQAATKDYVDSVAINVQIACKLSTTADLAGYTYNNGALGVGATLTAGGVGVLTVDGVATVLNDRILIQFQTAQEQNGAYYVSTEGTAGVAAILTRATDYDTVGEMQAGDQFSVVAGTLYAASIWMMSQTNPIIVGTTAITFQQIAGLGALLKANNLSDLPSAATARTNLGLAIGTNVQAYDATLQSLSALGTAADKIAYTTGIDTWAETGISATGRTLIAGADATAMRVTLGLVIGTNVQAWSSKLDSLAAPTYALGDLIYGSGANTVTNLAGNTLATKKYLSQTGTGAVSAAPIWATIAGSDVTGAALTKSDDTNVTLTLGGSASTALLNAASLTLGWAGQLSLSRGGSNASLTASNGGIIYSTGSAMGVLAGTVTARQMLQSSASTTPAWSSTTWPATSTINQLLYSSSANVIAGLSTVNSGVLVTSATGVPSIAVGQIPGSATNDNASAGNLGEYISSFILDASAVSLTTGVTANVTSIVLSGGRWLVFGNTCVTFSVSGTQSYSWLDTTSASFPDNSKLVGSAPITGSINILASSTMPIRLTLPAGSNTVYVSTYAAFASGTAKASGGIWAVRV